MDTLNMNFFRARIDDVAGMALGGAIFSSLLAMRKATMWEPAVYCCGLSAAFFILKWVVQPRIPQPPPVDAT